MWKEGIIQLQQWHPVVL